MSRYILVIALILTAAGVVAVEPPGGALNTGSKPRVIVSTDIGGSDPDDFQSMVHYLVYADVFDTEGLISSPPHAGRKKDIEQCLKSYERDYANLRTWGDYPSPAILRSVTKQGATEKQLTDVPTKLSDGAAHIIQRAKLNDKRPLYILVWGAITDVAQAIHAEPSIKSKIRVYFIASWNAAVDRKADTYLMRHHVADTRNPLWMVRSDSTSRGMYIGGSQSGDLGNTRFSKTHVNGHGSLGSLFWDKKPSIKMGDTPTVTYLLTGDPDDPTGPSWGGSFKKFSDRGSKFWSDRPEQEFKEGRYLGVKTVSIWREQYLRDWQHRMDRANAAKPGGSNTNPVITSGPSVDHTVIHGESVAVRVSAEDRDGDTVQFQWSASGPAPVRFARQQAATTASFTKAGTYTLQVAISDGNGGHASGSVDIDVRQVPSALVLDP